MEEPKAHFIEIIRKAFKEFGFIEFLSEALAGFLFAMIAFFKGWINSESAFEICLECVGCAILMPTIAFILRVFCVAPSELLKESLEAKEGHEISPKSIYPSIIAMLLGTCSFLIVCIIFSVKLNIVKIAERHGTPEPQKEAAAKRLPDKIIPKEERPPPSKPSFETNNPTLAIMTNDAMAKLKSEQNDFQKRKKAQILETAQKEWSDNLSERKYAVEELHAILSQEAAKRGEAIAKTPNYLQCLPLNLTPEDMDIDETNLAEIRFEKQTNISFTIWLINHMDTHKLFRVQCGAGYMDLYSGWGGIGGDQLGRIINIPGEQLNRINKEIPNEQYQEIISEGLRALVTAQIKSANTNNSDTNIIDNSK
jgi:hypothetical protein